MNFYGIILAFILCMSFTSVVYNHHPNALLRTCADVHRKPLKYVCSSKYPKLAKILYDDDMATIGMQYTIYQLENKEGYYFVSHGRSELNNCRRLTVQDQKTFTCDNKKALLPDSQVYCVKYTIQLVDILLHHCTTTAMAPTKFSAMQYVATFSEEEIEIK